MARAQNIPPEYSPTRPLVGEAYNPLLGHNVPYGFGGLGLSLIPGGALNEIGSE